MSLLDIEGAVARANHQRAEVSRLRQLHQLRGEHLYLCTCRHGPVAIEWGGGRCCPRCGHWVRRPLAETVPRDGYDYPTTLRPVGEEEGPGKELMVEQKIVIVQIPSEAHAERTVNERLSDETLQGWRTRQMLDHNGLLVLLMERDQTQ